MIMSFQNTDEIAADVVFIPNTLYYQAIFDLSDQCQGHLGALFRVQAHCDPGCPCRLGQEYPDAFQQAPCVFRQPGQRDLWDDQLAQMNVTDDTFHSLQQMPQGTYPTVEADLTGQVPKYGHDQTSQYAHKDVRCHPLVVPMANGTYRHDLLEHLDNLFRFVVLPIGRQTLLRVPRHFGSLQDEFAIQQSAFGQHILSWFENDLSLARIEPDGEQSMYLVLFQLLLGPPTDDRGLLEPTGIYLCLYLSHGGPGTSAALLAPLSLSLGLGRVEVDVIHDRHILALDTDRAHSPHDLQRLLVIRQGDIVSELIVGNGQDQSTDGSFHTSCQLHTLARCR